ncbi:MAG TPA: hypothetical protein VHL58_05370 [Thermoanaerobaculia bacterium]|nr:hypothetical protein [Thermoanaerobaculia bacterium]
MGEQRKAAEGGRVTRGQIRVIDLTTDVRVVSLARNDVNSDLDQ